MQNNQPSQQGTNNDYSGSMGVQQTVGWGPQPPQPYQITQPQYPNIYQAPNKSKNSKVLLWILIPVILLIVAIAVIVLANSLSSAGNAVVGDWKCKGFDGTGESEDYRTRIQLNSDGTFVYGAYDNLKDNHYAGTYTVTDLEKENFTKDYKYYLVEFGETTEYIYDGEYQDVTGRQMSKMEMGITNLDDKRGAITIFYSNYNMYYCYAD